MRGGDSAWRGDSLAAQAAVPARACAAAAVSALPSPVRL